MKLKKCYHLKSEDKLMSLQFLKDIFIIECKASQKIGLTELQNKLDRWLILKPFIEDRCKEILELHTIQFL